MAFNQNSMAEQNGVDSVPNKEYSREIVAWNGVDSVPDSENGEDSGFSTSPISNADFQGEIFLLSRLL